MLYIWVVNLLNFYTLLYIWVLFLYMPEKVAVEMGHVLIGGAVDMGGLIGISPAPPVVGPIQ